MLPSIVCQSERTNDGRLEVHEHGTWHVLAGARFREERVEGVIAAAQRLVRRHLPVGLDAMLQTVQLPARIADLHASLTHVNRDHLTLKHTIRQASAPVTRIRHFHPSAFSITRTFRVKRCRGSYHFSYLAVFRESRNTVYLRTALQPTMW